MTDPKPPAPAGAPSGAPAGAPSGAPAGAPSGAPAGAPSGAPAGAELPTPAVPLTAATIAGNPAAAAAPRAPVRSAGAEAMRLLTTGAEAMRAEILREVAALDFPVDDGDAVGAIIATMGEQTRARALARIRAAQVAFRIKA